MTTHKKSVQLGNWIKTETESEKRQKAIEALKKAKQQNKPIRIIKNQVI